MWNLGQIRDRLGERLAETDTTFWGTQARDNAINEAQRFVAAVTKGVPATVSGNVDTTTPYLTAPGKLLGDYVSAGRVDGGRALTYVRVEDANRGFPNWPTYQGAPRWVIPAPNEGRLYVVPAPATPTAVTINASVLPADVTGDSDFLFNNEPTMEKYQGVVLMVAATLLLYQERYDQDAERFYQHAVQEMQNLGVAPAEIPPMPQVVQDG